MVGPFPFLPTIQHTDLSHISPEKRWSPQEACTYPSGSHWGKEESPSSEIFKKRRKKLAHEKWKSAYGLGSEQSRSHEPFCDRTNLKSKPIPYYLGHQINCCGEQYLLHSKQKDLKISGLRFTGSSKLLELLPSLYKQLGDSRRKECLGIPFIEVKGQLGVGLGSSNLKITM